MDFGAVEIDAVGGGGVNIGVCVLNCLGVREMLRFFAVNREGSRILRRRHRIIFLPLCLHPRSFNVPVPNFS